MNRRRFIASLVAGTAGALLGVQPRQLGSTSRPTVDWVRDRVQRLDLDWPDPDFLTITMKETADDHVRMGHLWTEEIV